MQYPVDPHTHTLASGHAYSTVEEMVRAARSRSVELLGITEHGPGTAGSVGAYYFQNLHVLPREWDGLRVLFGAEVSVLDAEGALDLDDRTLAGLDIVIASLHNGTSFPSGGAEMNTHALVNAMRNPHVHIIGHPDDARYPLDYPLLVRAAGESGVLLELNNSSLDPKGWRKDAAGNMRAMLRLCREQGVPVSLGSDAHHAGDVAGFGRVLPLLEELDFPEELIANRSAGAFLRYTGKEEECK